MTKKQIVKQIAERVGLTQVETKLVVQQTFDAIIDAIARDKRIELRNFGVFEVKERAPRKARNPRTGEPVDVPAKKVVVFKPGRKMEAIVQNPPPLEAARPQRLLPPLPPQY
ncbi:MAG: HU family DNA-binding protein [Planctomycetota bacterium]|jgi:nucleoid DNA-binding protein